MDECYWWVISTSILTRKTYQHHTLDLIMDDCKDSLLIATKQGSPDFRPLLHPFNTPHKETQATD